MSDQDWTADGEFVEDEDAYLDVLGRIEQHLAALVRAQLMTWEYQARVAEGDLTLKEINQWVESMGLEDYRDHVLNKRLAANAEADEAIRREEAHHAEQA